MQIIRCDHSQAAAWNAFVTASPRASFYHRWEWRAINERAFGHASVYLAATENGRVVGVFPLVRLKSLLFGNLACSMPFVNYGGPVGDSEAIEQQLLAASRQVADEWGVDYLEIRSEHFLGDAWPSSDHKISLTVALNADPEALWNGFKTGHRQDIRKAAKNGFVVKFGPELIDDFFTILSESWRELGTPIYRASYLKDVVASFASETQLCVIYAADGTPAAGALSGIQGGTAEGMWLGTRSQFRREQVGYVLYWEIIQDACRRGLQAFHLGRSSKDSGGETFKKKWNATARQLYWHYYLRTRSEMPSLNPNNPKYQMAIKAWRQLPLPVTQAIGPFIARSIP